MVISPLVLRTLVCQSLGLKPVATRRRRLTAGSLTLVLAVTLASVAAFVGWQATSGPIVILKQPGLLIVGALVALFFLAEYVLLNVEFRRQAHSLTLAGLPLALGVLLAPAHTAVAARVVGALAALLLQRVNWQKLIYNVAGYAFEAAVSSAVARLIIGPAPQLGVGTFAVVLVVVMVVDQVMSALVLWIIRLHGGQLDRAQVRDVLVTSLVLSVLTSAFATAMVVLIARAGVLGVELVVVITVVAAVAYAGYASTRRRHQSLELMHSFVADGLGADSVTALIEQLLTRIRTLMNATTAELRLFEPKSDLHPTRDPSGPVDPQAFVAVRMINSDDERLSITREQIDPADWLTLRVRTEHEPALLARDTKDRTVRTWLGTRMLRDAVIVPLPGGQANTGLILVNDRLGETATFTTDDVSLLQTLTGHLAVALRSTQLLEKLTYDASHDSLTGLYNRSYLADRIQHDLAQPPRTEGGVAVLLLDLDGFKEVNDTLGHDAGDRLLQVVAQRLLARTPTEATVARIGGDEFAVLFPAVSGSQDHALHVAQQIAEHLHLPVHLNDSRVEVQVSIGVAFTAGGNPADDLLRQADTAMYTAKAARFSACLYDPTMDRIRIERLALLADLRTALHTDPDQFLLHFQPQVDLNTGMVVAVEALVRWQHSRLGFIGPDLFIPLAESSGLIDELTPLVLDAALTECARWTAQGHRINVAVNISARNVENAELPHLVASALRLHGVAPAQLILEITESTVMGDSGRTLPVLHQLAELGLSLSLDDFGTGHSSLAYLHQLPVAEIKIDRSFILGLDSVDSTSSRALIRSIAGLGKALGLRVVAEGVEDEHRLAELREFGCDIAQGYHISRPLPAPDLHRWLARHPTHYPPLLTLLSPSAGQ